MGVLGRGTADQCRDRMPGSGAGDVECLTDGFAAWHAVRLADGAADVRAAGDRDGGSNRHRNGAPDVEANPDVHACTHVWART